MNLQQLFDNVKLTENGDLAYKKVSSDVMLNILFMTEYYSKHLDEVPHLEYSPIDKLFAMFIRDPRYGLGKRDLGRKLMSSAKVSFEDALLAGRADDLLFMEWESFDYYSMLDYLKSEIDKGNELVKKWMPRYSSKHLLLARQIAKYWDMNKQQYGHFIKCNTTENKMSDHRWDDVEFEHVPSLAMLKYAKAFSTKAETKARYAKYLEDVKAGKKDLHVATTSVYDIYRNRKKIDADLFFSKLEKISGSWIPVVDSSGSMQDMNDSYGKAMAIGHYLAKCSTYAPNQVVSFSSRPQLLTLGNLSEDIDRYWMPDYNKESEYEREIASMYTGDCSNTDFGKVMQLLSNLDGEIMPEYLIVLSDMEFDQGSRTSKDATMQLFKEKGYTTKIVWWNLNSRHTTCPEMDNSGNIFLSGYNPMLLKFLQAGFDTSAFLHTLLQEYAKSVGK